MTIASTARKAGPLLGNGSTTSFSFSFKVFATSDIKVAIANSAGVETVLVENTHYTVSLNANQETSPGGAITYPISGSPLPSGSVLSIIGDLDYGQPLDLPSGGNFNPTALENQLDRTVMQVQQLKEQVDRSAKLPQTSSQTPDELVFNITRLGESADNIDTVATGIAAVTTVAADIADVNTVAGSIGNVNATGANIDAVVTVANDLNEPVSEIETVAANITNVNATGSNIASVNTVAGISSAVSTVAGIAPKVSIVADNVADVTNFSDVYYGPSATNPTLRKDGSALQGGDLYFNTGTQRLRVFDGATWVDGPVNAGTITRDTFSGTGAQTAFTLSADPVSENNTQVFIGGVYQQKSEYSVSGTALTFASAPPAGTNNIEVLSTTTLALGTTTANLVGYDGGTAQDVLDDAKPLANYTALRNYTGRATGVRITQTGLAGFFQRDAADTTSADNGGTIIVDASGRRWKRLFTGPLNIKWFGAASNWNGSTGTDDTAAIQAALDYAYSLPGIVELVNPGVSKVTGTLIMGSNVIFRRGGLTCTADNIPIIKVSKDALNSYWQIRDMALVYQNPQSAVGSGNAIQLGDTNTISYEYEIANISTNNARSAVSLPSLTGAFAFLGRHQNIRSYKGTGTAFEILGSATGAHTTLSFIDCYYQGEPGAEISTASLFNIRNVVGLNIDQCACDRSALSTGSLALFTSCKGRIGTIVLEGNPMSRSSGLGSFFEFSGGEMVCSHLIATAHNITLTGSGGFGFVRLGSGAIVTVDVISDLNTTVVDSSSDSYYTVAIDSTSILYNDAFKSSGATPALSTNEFSTTNPTKYARRLNGSTRTAVEAGRLVMFGTAPPTSGTFAVGDKVKNTAVSGASPVTEWQCLTAGTPGTWRAVGSFNGLGPTANRPTLTANDRGVMYFDTTLDADGKPIWWTGSAWVDATGAVV